MHESPVKVWTILGAMAVGALLGVLVGPTGTVAGIDVIAFCDFLGQLFLNLLRMLIVPLVMASVITGVAGIGGSRNLGKLGGTSVLFYVLTTLIAVLIALFVLNVVQPGIVNGQPARDLLALHADASAVDISVRASSSSSSSAADGSSRHRDVAVLVLDAARLCASPPGRLRGQASLDVLLLQAAGRAVLALPAAQWLALPATGGARRELLHVLLFIVTL